ncbi:MAG: CPBP family intramembrane glutamic endopeptidase [Saprospiraceae bacterium]
MKTILKYLKDFWKTDFDPPVYFLTILGLAIAIFFNYKYDFEDSILDRHYGEHIYFFYSFLYYGAAYYYVIALYFIFKRDLGQLKNRAFWISSLFFIGMLAFKSWFWWGLNYIPEDVTRAERYFYRKTILAAKTVVIYTVLLVLFYKLVEKVKSNWYGLTTPDFNWRPYALMLLVMVPLIAAAATQPDFLASYPKLRMSVFKEDYWNYFVIYEPVYLLGFIMIEWLFRGFLVIGMVHLLGHRAILPAAALYCVFHFGKPAGECISSFFGGYILGVFAYYSRSIWGGIIVHMGIALLMDLAAVIGAAYFK